MKKAIYIVLIMILCCGCQKQNNNHSRESVNDVSIEKTDEDRIVLEEELNRENDFFTK